MSTPMPVNPATGLYNVTPAEVDAARAENPLNVRQDGTLTRSGQAFVAFERALDPAPEGWEEYERVNAAQHAANPNRLDGEL